MPPAAQAATRANCPSSLASLFAAVVTSLTPVAPNGWPSDKDPPHRLNLSMDGAPTCVHKGKHYKKCNTFTALIKLLKKLCTNFNLDICLGLSASVLGTKSFYNIV